MIARMFIGSSSEGSRIAWAIQANMETINTCECKVWDQGIFGLGGGTLDTLVAVAPTFDFATLVLTPDDMTTSRRKTQQSPRDNVLLEIGLFLGVLGKERAFVAYDRSAKDMKIPTDLAGVTLAGYAVHKDGNLEASVGAACTKIDNAIRKLGPKNTSKRDILESLSEFIKDLQFKYVRESTGQDKDKCFTEDDLKKFCEDNVGIKAIDELCKRPKFRALLREIGTLPPNTWRDLEECIKPLRPTWYENRRISSEGQTDAGQQAERIIASYVIYLVKRELQIINHI